MKMEKSYFDVLGLCCSSEVPLIEKILTPLQGVHRVSVIVPSRTVIVIHDALLISTLQIVKALNQARLEANVRVRGEKKYQNKWPSPFAVACGVLLLLSFLHYIFEPFKWLALAAVAVGIFPIIRKAIASLRNFILDVNILMLIAVGGSIFLKDYWEAGTIVFLFTTAEWLESRASHKATAVMSSLMNIAPQKAVLADTGEEVNANEVKVNTRLAVKAGDIIPIDGTIVEGKCEVDERALTGESFPVSKQVDSIVWAGTINLNGYISVNTTALAEDCVVARMAKLVEEAQNNKSKTQRYIDKCAKYYTPGVVLVAVCLAVIPAAMRVHKVEKWYHLALVVLVSACPCALILSTPVATYCALSKAATSGLLVKGAEYLETLSKVKIICFDKTGTITRGEFSVSNFRSVMEDLSLDKLLYWVSSIESKSSHPMAAALIEYAQSHSVEPQPDKVDQFEIFPGEGIYGKIDGKDVYVGNKKIATRAGYSKAPRNEHETEGNSSGYIFLGSSLAGVFGLSDTCRTGVKEALKQLKSMGIKTAMLTGDSQSAANHALNQLGDALETVHAELLPQDKAQIIKQFQKESPTAMVGDGINDAPALATADIGISMGISGSALATETGHVILMSNDIRKIPMAVKLARKTRRKIFENIFIAIFTKAAIIALAIAGHPLVWAAVLADVGTCLIVILNSMLLLRATKIRKTSKKHSGSSHDHTHCHSKKPLNVGKKHGCCSHDDNVHEMKHPVQVTEAKHGCCGHEGKVHEMKHSVQVTEAKHGCCVSEGKVHETKHSVQVTEAKHGCCGHEGKVHVTEHAVQVEEAKHGCCGHEGKVHVTEHAVQVTEENHGCGGHDDKVHEMKNEVQVTEGNHSCCGHDDDDVHEVKHCVQGTEDDCCAHHVDEEVHDIEHDHTCCADHDDDDNDIHEVQVKHGCCGHDEGDDIQEVKHLVRGNCSKIMTEDLKSRVSQTNHEKPSCHLSVEKKVDKSHNCDGGDHHHHHHHGHGHGHGHHGHGHGHVKEYITEEELGKLVRNCCKNHGLEKMHVGGCCKSFRKECCGHNHFGVGGLSEIVIE